AHKKTQAAGNLGQRAIGVWTGYTGSRDLAKAPRLVIPAEMPPISAMYRVVRFSMPVSSFLETQWLSYRSMLRGAKQGELATHQRLRIISVENAKVNTFGGLI